MIWQTSSGGFEAHPGTPFPSPPYSASLPTTEAKHPRGTRGPDEGDRRSWGAEAISLDPIVRGENLNP